MSVLNRNGTTAIVKMSLAKIRHIKLTKMTKNQNTEQNRRKPTEKKRTRNWWLKFTEIRIKCRLFQLSQTENTISCFVLLVHVLFLSLSLSFPSFLSVLLLFLLPSPVRHGFCWYSASCFSRTVDRSGRFNSHL